MAADQYAGRGRIPQHGVQGAAALAGILRDRVHPGQHGVHRQELGAEEVGLALDPDGGFAGEPMPLQGGEHRREPAGLPQRGRDEVAGQVSVLVEDRILAGDEGAARGRGVVPGAAHAAVDDVFEVLGLEGLREHDGLGGRLRMDDLPGRERERVGPVEVDGHGLDEGIAGYVRHPVHGIDEAGVDLGVDVGVAVGLHGEREHPG